MKKLLALFLSLALIMSFVPFSLIASAEDADSDNTMMFAVEDDADGKLYYTSYKYGINGLGYAQKGFLRTSSGASFTTGDGSAFLFAREIDGEKMWKFDFNTDENGNHIKPEGGGTYIYPFYTSEKTIGTVFPDAAEYTHLAVRIKLVDDGSGKIRENATRPLSLNLLAAGATDANYGAWEDKKNVYFQDINTGEKIYVTKEVMEIPVGFDGYVVFPSNAVVSKVDGSVVHTSLSDFYRLHIMLHWNCKHSTTKATDNWAGTEFYVGDMILTKNIDSFNLVYGTPSFELTSNDTSITVISDDNSALYSLSKDADISAWLPKDAFNETLKNLSKATKYTIHSKYATGNKIISKEISTTATGIEGYLMDIPEEETFYSYKDKYVGWGSRLTMKSGQDPLSESPSYNSQGGLYSVKSGDEYFLILNPQEVPYSSSTNPDHADPGKIQESNGGIYFNSVSGRGFNEDGTVKKGMPQGVNIDNIEALAVRLKVTGGEKDQYSSFTMYASGYLDLSSAYFIDNVSGCVVRPYNFSGHRFGVTSDVDGWLIVPYESISPGIRSHLESEGSNIEFYFHTELCKNAAHGKDTDSNWANRTLWVGDIAILSNEDDFIRTYSNPPALSGGMAFSRNDAPFVDGQFDKMINTFEATIKLPKNFPANVRPGVMYGSYGVQNKGLNFEIYTNGNPRIYYKKDTRTGPVSYSKLFDKINVLNGEKTHIAFVNDQKADTVSCYINGQLMQTLEGAIPDWISLRPGVLGGDYSDINTYAFCGEMFSVALYSDVRTAKEIKSDMTEVASDSLMAHWDLTKPATDGIIPDESGNGHDVILGKYWFTDKEEVTGYDYSFALVGDTQVVNLNYQDRFDRIYKWIAQNKQSKKIEYVLGLGDITDNNKVREWETADAGIALLDGVVPYSLVRGNHDGTELFNSTFDKAPYNTTFKEKYNKLENTYRELVIGDIRYLIFTLDIGAGDDVLAWAGNIIDAHPEHNVIITTHIYLDNEGQHITSESNLRAAKYGGSNEADEVWDKFISQHQNITMVYCGHVSQGRAILNQQQGVNGNVVSQLLVDPQGVDANLGATGMVTMLYFSEDGSRVTVETYSTIQDKYYLTHGQFSFDVNVIKHEHSYEGKTVAPTCTENGYTEMTCTYCGDSYTETLEALGHNMIYVETVEPSASGYGYDLYLCENCGETEERNITQWIDPSNCVANVKTTASDVDVTLSWSAFDGAVEYYAKVYDKDFTKCLKTITTTDTSAVFDYKTLSYNTDYKFIVTAKLSSGKYLTVANATRVDGAMVVGNRVVGHTVTMEGKGAIVDFLPVENATEYLVNVFENDAQGERIYTATLSKDATSARVMTNLSAGTKYVVMINAKVDGKYMSLADLRVNGIGVTFTAPVYNPTGVTIADETATSIRFNWDAVRGAEQYFIRVTEKESGKLVNTLKAEGKTTATLSRWTDGTKISPNTTYLLQFYTYVNSTTNSGEYGEPIEITTIGYEDVNVTANENDVTGKIDVLWNSTTNSVGYFVYTYKDGVKIANKYVDGKENTSISLTAPASSGTYTYGVVAYEKNSSGTAYTPVSVSNKIVK